MQRKINAKTIDYENLPLYSALIVNKETEDKINSILPIPKDFDDEYHTTICYSKKPVQVERELLNRDLPISGNAKVVDWVIFESENYGKSFCLVLKCDICTSKFNEFISSGASFDYENYVPHLTLYYDLPDEINPKELFEKFKGLEIVFDRIRYEEIDEEKYKNS